MNDTIKRIMKEVEDLEKNPLHDDGIYHYFSEDNIMNMKAMIIGPKDTPYEGGFFFFNITYPNDYPFKPPKVEFSTLDSRVRFNPNLYKEGKVCLSIINTWSGPSWTAAYTVRTVLLAISSMVLINNPLTNEPGHEDDYDSRIQEYNRILESETIRVAILAMLNKTPMTFKVFQEPMEEYYVKNFDKYMERAKYLKDNHNGKNLYCSMFSMKLLTNYAPLIRDMIKTYESISGEKYEADWVEKAMPRLSECTVDKLRELAKKTVVDGQPINIYKKSIKTGKMIKKTKKELYDTLHLAGVLNNY